MNLKAAADLLNGREYMSELTKAEEKELKESGIVSVFGASDDLVEIRGAIDDEVGAWNGTTMYFNSEGLLSDGSSDNKQDITPVASKLNETTKTIQARWDYGEYSWYMESSDITYEPFDILENGDKYCRGIVFSIDSLQ